MLRLSVAFKKLFSEEEDAIAFYFNSESTSVLDFRKVKKKKTKNKNVIFSVNIFFQKNGKSTTN